MSGFVRPDAKAKALSYFPFKRELFVLHLTRATSIMHCLLGPVQGDAGDWLLCLTNVPETGTLLQ